MKCTSEAEGIRGGGAGRPMTPSRTGRRRGGLSGAMTAWLKVQRPPARAGAGGRDDVDPIMIIVQVMIVVIAPHARPGWRARPFSTALWLPHRVDLADDHPSWA